MVKKWEVKIVPCNKLKPCPFCGGNAQLLYEPRPIPKSIHGNWFYVLHKCGNDLISTKLQTNGYRKKTDAINAWNQRYKETQQAIEAEHDKAVSA